MKRIIFIFCMMLVLSLCGCADRLDYMSKWFDSEQKISDNMMGQIVDICNNRDIEKFKKLFSENSLKNIQNIDKQISSFFEFIDGDIQKFYGDCASSNENDKGNKRIELNGMYHILTSENEYCVNFYMYTKDDKIPSNIGLYKIEIATEEVVNKENFVWDTPDEGVFIENE